MTTSTELTVRDQKVAETVQLVRHPQFLEQVQESLPEGVPVTRFVQIALTAIRLRKPSLPGISQNTTRNAPSMPAA